MDKKVVTSENAPQAIGPYSLAIRAGSMLYTSGQVGIDPGTKELVAGGVEAETRQALLNLQQVLESGGSSMEHVVKTLVFLGDMADFPKMNAVYAEFFPQDPPARSTIGVAGLPKGAAVEIEMVALTE